MIVPGKGHGLAKFLVHLKFFSDAYLALADENKKIHFGLAPVIEVSSFPIPVNRFQTKITCSRTVFPLILTYPFHILPYLFSPKHESC